VHANKCFFGRGCLVCAVALDLHSAPKSRMEGRFRVPRIADESEREMVTGER
jgi:hypothetical protein